MANPITVVIPEVVKQLPQLMYTHIDVYVYRQEISLSLSLSLSLDIYIYNAGALQCEWHYM